MSHKAGLPSFTTREFMPRSTRYCICVITQNEGERLKGQLARMSSQSHLADIIVIDGSSSDGSTDPAFLQTCNVRTLLNTTTPGLSTATRIGFAYGLEENYAGVITIDGNGKDVVSKLDGFIQALDEGFDLVQGSRFMRGGKHSNTPLKRYIGIRFVLSPLVSLFSGYWYSDPTNAFRAMSRRYLEEPDLQPLRSEFVRFSLQHYLIYRAPRLKYRVKEIPVERNYPPDGSIPTKITGLRQELVVLTELIEVILGRYNPKKSR